MTTLTGDQLRCAGSRATTLFLEAAPGSGKTTVAAHRFALRRYARPKRPDPRGVVAVSFTRAATRELRVRVQRQWGRGAVRLPHRVITLDTLICDLVHVLLAAELLKWPGRHKLLDVRDTWKSLVSTSYANRDITVYVADNTVMVGSVRTAERQTSPSPAGVLKTMREGVCTHDEVRVALEHAVAQPDQRAVLIEHMRRIMRALIVDEVFDANELDLEVVQLACDADIDVTLIGDPWQALYRFRGARPDLVPELVEANAMTTLPLTESFRWRSDAQAELARKLRAGESTTIDPAEPEHGDPDVVLATRWADLWDLDARVLPLAFGAAKGNIEEAGATLLLDYVTRTLLGVGAVYTADALSTLRIVDLLATDRLDAGWPAVIEQLLRPGAEGPKAGYIALVDLIASESDGKFRAVHGAYTKRLAWLRERLELDGDLILGLSVHQAKGCEWDTVGLALKPAHVEHLSNGLSHTETTHRELYVACTRARVRTLAV
jgi:DNA helicase-2/ATP-dependent DNA helicase PcrA